MSRPSTSLARCLALLAAVVLVSGCGDGSGPTPPLTGSYTLRTLDGRTVPATTVCGELVTSGTLAITSDSIVLHLTTGQGSDALSREARGSYTKSADDERLVVSYEGSVLGDTVTVGGGGRVTDRAWLSVPASCTGTSSWQANLGFSHD